MYVKCITINLALDSDLAEIFNLLERCDLPIEGLAEHLSSTLVARDGGKVVGCAALEIYGKQALLRSVAVDESLRGQGWGQRLTGEALEMATRLGITEVYLLTETAAAFFPRFGFATIARSEVPSTVRQSLEFTTLCPDSAIVMTKRIQTTG